MFVYLLFLACSSYSDRYKRDVSERSIVDDLNTLTNGDARDAKDKLDKVDRLEEELNNLKVIVKKLEGDK